MVERAYNTLPAITHKLSLLDSYDNLFDLTYLMEPPYDTANEVAEAIDIAIYKAFKQEN